jgi:pyruvate,water dikinase
MPPLLDISKDTIESLKKTILDIQNIFNKPMDIEFTIKAGVIYILQARPITAYNSTEVPTIIKTNMGDMNIFSVSKGNFSWKIKIITSEKEINEIDEELVVITDKLYPWLMRKMDLIKWIVSVAWGQLSHLAIVWRETGTPILSNCIGLIDLLKEKQYKQVTFDRQFLNFNY